MRPSDTPLWFTRPPQAPGTDSTSFRFQIDDVEEELRDPGGHFNHWTHVRGFVLEGAIHPNDWIVLPGRPGLPDWVASVCNILTATPVRRLPLADESSGRVTLLVAFPAPGRVDVSSGEAIGCDALTRETLLLNLFGRSTPFKQGLLHCPRCAAPLSEKRGAAFYPVLLECTRHADGVLAQVATHALAYYDEPDAIPALIQASDSASAAVRREAALLLYNHRHMPEVQAAFRARHADPDVEVRSVAAKVLGRAEPQVLPSALDDLLREAHCETDADRERAKRAIVQLITAPLTPSWLDRPVDRVLEEIDVRLGTQIHAILHHPAFQKLEATWRGLGYLIDQVDFGENIRVELLNVSKEDLGFDFEDSAEVAGSGLYKILEQRGHLAFGFKPYGLLVGDYEFANGHQDIVLLQRIAAVAARMFTPFLTGASPRMFGLDAWEALPGIKDIKALFESPQYARWQAFRTRDDARYVGLTMPRFLLRLPYGADAAPAEAFPFEEDVRGRPERLLWGNAAVALAACVAGSFAKYRWCPNIVGPGGGGAVEDLPRYPYTDRSGAVTQISTEVPLTERREYELSEEGFIGLTFRKGLDHACFFSANSCQKPRSFGKSKEGHKAETNHRLDGQLPYLFITSRLAHYVRVLQRENIGVWKGRDDIERGLYQWLAPYTTFGMDTDENSILARIHPLHRIEIKVEEVEGVVGWYRFELKVSPQFKYVGARFTLSLVGALAKER